VLVTCAVTRRAFLARSGDLRTYRADLDNALVDSEALVVGAAPDLLIPKQPWASALVARALADVDMDRPGALAAAQLLASGRRPGTLRSYEGKFDRFFRFCTDVQISQGFPALSPMPATSSSVLLYLGWLCSSSVGRIRPRSSTGPSCRHRLLVGLVYRARLVYQCAARLSVKSSLEDSGCRGCASRSLWPCPSKFC